MDDELKVVLGLLLNQTNRATLRELMISNERVVLGSASLRREANRDRRL
jgi:hypothetical protein